MSSRPPSGSMVYWRFKGNPSPYRFGYVSLEKGGLVRMGCWNGDTAHGSIVDPSEIEWRNYA